MSPPIDIIAGARPNFVKVAPIVHALQARRAQGGPLRWRLVHTGQHYDARLSGDFFTQLRLPPPDAFLDGRSGSHAEQTAAIMIGYERLLQAAPCRLCLVVGDVNSTLACALTARKAGVPVAHVEAGLRSGDRTLPEEINRLATDAVSDWFFTTSRQAGDNLRRSGAPEDRIFFVGNTMIDTLLANLDRLKPPDLPQGRAPPPGGYFVLTLHRPANVDDAATLSALLNTISAQARGLPVVFPVHPRTARTLERLPDLPSGLWPVAPQPYLEFIHLIRHARAVITDSGGVSEETTVLGVPCMTLRDSTERPETVSVGVNELLGTDPAAFGPAMARLFDGRWKTGRAPEKWDGRAGVRIVAILETLSQE